MRHNSGQFVNNNFNNNFEFEVNKHNESIMLYFTRFNNLRNKHNNNEVIFRKNSIITKKYKIKLKNIMINYISILLLKILTTITIKISILLLKILTITTMKMVHASFSVSPHQIMERITRFENHVT